VPKTQTARDACAAVDLSENRRQPAASRAASRSAIGDAP
jgi:hypothetical protein